MDMGCPQHYLVGYLQPDTVNANLTKQETSWNLAQF